MKRGANVPYSGSAYTIMKKTRQRLFRFARAIRLAEVMLYQVAAVILDAATSKYLLKVCPVSRLNSEKKKANMKK